MKIVLQAFGNKLSGVMEVPEETGRTFKLAMSQPIQVFKKSHKLTHEPLTTVCKFEWTGGTFIEDGHEWDGAREYQLVEIEKT